MSLWKFTNLLTDCFYENTLNTDKISQSFAMMKKAEKGCLMKGTNFYFDGKNNVGLKIMLTNNQWAFGEGMNLCMWITIYHSKESKFLHLIT